MFSEFESQNVFEFDSNNVFKFESHDFFSLTGFWNTTFLLINTNTSELHRGS